MIFKRSIMKNVKHRLTKGIINVLVGLSLIVVGSFTYAESSWPESTVTIVVPYPAGGAADHSARAIARGLEKELGQTVVIDNRPGARSEEHTSELQSRG